MNLRMDSRRLSRCLLGLTAAAAGAFLSTSALALPPATLADYTIYAAGSSEQANVVVAMANRMFTMLDSYTDNSTGANSSSYRILFGKTSMAVTFNGTTIPSGRNVLLFYKFSGSGFANGIQPQVLSGSALTYPAVSQISTSVATGNSFPLPSFRTTALTTQNQVPDWGLTDAELDVLNTPYNLPTGISQLTFLQRDSVNRKPLYEVMYGVAVTNTLYASKTNFTRQEVADILSGTLIDWSEIHGDNGAFLAPGPIVLLDRTQGSGSKVAANQFFLQYPGPAVYCHAYQSDPCNITPTPGQTPGSVAFGYTGTRITLPVTDYEDVNESSVGNLIEDLNAANVAGVRAISILSLQSPPSANRGGNSSNQYSFAKIDGIAADAGTATDNINGVPGSRSTYVRAIKGEYGFVYGTSFNTRTGFLGLNTTNAVFANWARAVLASDPLFLGTTFTNVIVGASTGLAFPNGVHGILVDPIGTGGPAILRAGVATTSRAANSAGPLWQIFDPTVSLPSSSDPL